MDTYANTYAAPHIVAARTAHVTADTMSALDIDDILINASGGVDCVSVGNRHLVVDIRGGWLTVARQEWTIDSYGGEWITKVEVKHRRKALVGARKVTDSGAWLVPGWEASATYVASLPGAVEWLVIDPATMTREDHSAFFAYCDEATRRGAAVEWQGKINGVNVQRIVATAGIVTRIAECIEWFANRGATIERIERCSEFSAHSHRTAECRHCRNAESDHNRAPIASGTVDIDGKRVQSRDTVERAVTVEFGSGTVGERGTVIYAGSPRCDMVIVMWERTDQGKPFRAFPSHVRVIDPDQAPAVTPAVESTPAPVDQVTPAATDAERSALFDLDGRTAIVAYTDATGRVFCPTHRDYARGIVDAETVDNSAMDDIRCDGCDMPIARIMLAARAANFADNCFQCRKSVRENVNTRPCADHMTHPAEILAAIVDGTPLPASPYAADTDQDNDDRNAFGMTRTTFAGHTVHVFDEYADGESVVRRYPMRRRDSRW